LGGPKVNLPRIKTLWIKPDNLDLILQGEKKVEVRVGYGNIRRLQNGDQLWLNDEHLFTIVRVGLYSGFEEMLENEDSSLISPGVTAHEVLARCRDIYPPDKEALGVVALEIRPLQAGEGADDEPR
jgi:ASC-1-like (ASCH) protein